MNGLGPEAGAMLNRMEAARIRINHEIVELVKREMNDAVDPDETVSVLCEVFSQAYANVIALYGDRDPALDREAMVQLAYASLHANLITAWKTVGEA